MYYIVLCAIVLPIKIKWCLIKDYYLSLSPHLPVLVPPCCVHRDRRPDLTVSGTPSPRFVLFFFSSFYFCPVFCLSRQASPLAASPHARRSQEISAAGCGYPRPAGWFSGSRGAAPPSPPARLWLNARRPASDSSPPDHRWLKPAGSPLTHARRQPLTLAPWIQSTRHSQESRVCVLLCPQEHFNHLV